MQVIGHRGANRERPENTLAAFERALELGADGIEADVLLSRDGRLVVRHDDLIQHDGRWRAVRELTWDELQRVDLGGGARMPAAEALIEQFASRCQVVLELKGFGTAQPLAALLKDLPKRDPSRSNLHVTSFLSAELAEFAERDPDTDRSLTLAAAPPDVGRLCRDAQAKGCVSLSRGFLTEPLVRRLRAQEGLRVRAYTVNWLQEAEQFAAWGLEAIYTDDPGGMQPLRARRAA